MKQQIRSVLLLSVCLSLGLVVSQAQAQKEQAPIWAYGFSTQAQPGDTYEPQPNPIGGLLPGDDVEEIQMPHHVEGSSATYSRMLVRDGHSVIDWFPGDHPEMSDIMKHGPAATMAERGRGCASCHLPNGKGRPENAPPAGQPAAYTVQQLYDMRDGLRYTSDPRKRNTPTMIDLAKAMTEEEIQEAAEYFAAIPWTKWMNVVEADMIPEMHLEEGNMFITVGTEPTEPLGNRIVETPIDEHQANYLRNPRSAWNVYVPVGSLARGEDLVMTGAGKTIQCGICHGPDLMGLGNVPGIAGRSPSYMMRQLWDMRQGTRNGLQAQLMQPVIANLSVDDMTDIVAYLASVDVPPAPNDVQ